MDPYHIQSNTSKRDADEFENFWRFFTLHSDDFFKTIKSGKGVEEDFFEDLTAKLEEINEGIFFLVGMENESLAELIFTPVGAPKNVFLVEELVASAPKITHWQFRALKPANPKLDFDIKFDNLIFTKHNIKFYPIIHTQYPDEIDLMLVYDNFHVEAYEEIFNGIYLFLENYLGEEIMIESIDKIQVAAPNESNKELIPVSKLKDYLIWREKEFVEKYHHIKYNSKDNEYIGFEGIIEDNTPIVSYINANVIHWEFKASHPWILSVILESVSENNIIDDSTALLINQIHDDLEKMLPENKGNIFIGWHKVNGNIEIFYACQEFRGPSVAMREIEANFGNKLKVSYDIFKDKYWRTFEWYSKSGMLDI